MEENGTEASEVYEMTDKEKLIQEIRRKRIEQRRAVKVSNKGISELLNSSPDGGSEEVKENSLKIASVKRILVHLRI